MGDNPYDSFLHCYTKQILVYFSVDFLAMYCQAAEFGAQALHGTSTDSEEKGVTRENEKADFAAPSPANTTV